MNIDILFSIGSAILSVFGVVILSETARKIFSVFLGRKEPQETYSKKLERLTENLIKSSKEVDNVLGELSHTAIERERAVRNLELELEGLENQEKQLQERVHALENIPLPVAEHFAELTAIGERRSALRDYVLFGSGVIVSTIITIVLKLFRVG